MLLIKILDSNVKKEENKTAYLKILGKLYGKETAKLRQ